MIAALALFLITPVAGPLFQEAACTKPDLPAGLEGWAPPRSVKASSSASGAPNLVIGVGYQATLIPTPKVSYLLRPEKPGGSVSSGGILSFDVGETGRYRVALGSAAWVDVLKGTAAITSVEHGHGPDCSGIRKMVDFDLQPGRFTLQIAGNGGTTLPLMIARLP